MGIKTTVNAIIQQSRRTDPTIADALIMLADEVDRLRLVVDPSPVTQSKVNTPIVPPPADLETGAYEFTETNVILTWERVGTEILLYEIRQGAIWETADRLFITGNLQAVIDPLLIGTTTFLVKALNNSGIYSINALEFDVIVPDIGSFTLTTEVLNNFVTIDWDTPNSTFRIAYYVITKDGSTIVTNNPGSFFTRQEASAGTYEYGVTAIDIAGNESAEQVVSLVVNAPTDFEVQDSQTSDLSGTIVNGLVYKNKLYVSLKTTETYQQHFVNNGWASPQAQVNAGYNIWLLPANTADASYEETFDFGVIYSNIIVNLSWLFSTISGSFSFAIDVKVSDDNITYSSSFTSQSFFTTSARYVRVKLTFNPANDMSLMTFANFVCTLNVKREVDGGEIACLAADATGTVVTFNKAFKFVESITLTAKSTVERKTVYDFAGGTNPTTFKIKVYDAAGARVDSTVSWKARGVM